MELRITYRGSGIRAGRARVFHLTRGDRQSCYSCSAHRRLRAPIRRCLRSWAWGFPGALTNAVLCVRKAVFAADTADATARPADNPVPIPPIVFVTGAPGPVKVSGAQFCARAPDDPITRHINPVAAPTQAAARPFACFRPDPVVPDAIFSDLMAHDPRPRLSSISADLTLTVIKHGTSFVDHRRPSEEIVEAEDRHLAVTARGWRAPRPRWPERRWATTTGTLNTGTRRGRTSCHRPGIQDRHRPSTPFARG